MQLYIDNRSGAPIYDQIYSQIKDAILSGQVAEGEALPSIRALAKDLRISVITTKRAYDELENEGFIYTLPGKGCFVAERSTELLREENLRKIESHMQEIRRLANACRLTEQEFGGYDTRKARFRPLERALRQYDYKGYLLYCRCFLGL